ncbi:cytochrome P460 family protein [Roseibium sp.]|uniref:cytochrome P460 family protein n=1 Tax=Roseibium sp. TaxID=1936156 RepID=UPI001B2CF220|nr:cytochrome P460 family protein [Roseibium sp.]
MRKLSVWLGGAVASLALTATAHAACDVQKPGYELTGDEAEEIYDCLKADLQAGYQKGPKRWISEDFVKDYPDWTKASAFPAAPGFHGGRFLVTYVNAIGADEYLKYKPENVTIPAGTRIAKESFAVNDDGKVSRGPLFLMEKVAAGKSPETDDWYYMMVGPNGAPQAVNVMTACSECHMENFGEQGGLGYPVEDARIR